MDIQKGGKLLKNIIRFLIIDPLRKVLLIDPEQILWKEAINWISTFVILLIIAAINALAVDSDNFWKIYSKIISDYIILFSFITVIFNVLRNYLSSFKKSYENKFESTVNSLENKFESTVNSFENKFESTAKIITSKSDDITTLVDGYLNKAKIVFESGINDFDDLHLVALRKILDELNKSKDESINIYAIDNSDPRTWWSDTMTGYLALLADWKSQDTSGYRRNITRIFVCKKNELLNPLFVKTVSLHSLMGFNTYVITIPIFNKIIAKVRKENPDLIVNNKEVLIWTKTKNGEKKGEDQFTINLKINGPIGEREFNNVKCYQSFWDLSSDYENRIQLIKKAPPTDIKTYHNSSINTEIINIWFEFLAIKDSGLKQSENDKMKERLECWEKIPKGYSVLIQYITENSVCCEDSSEVKEVDGQDFAIRIKSKCSSCINNTTNCNPRSINKFDYTTSIEIHKMLNKYYEKQIQK